VFRVIRRSTPIIERRFQNIGGVVGTVFALSDQERGGVKRWVRGMSGSCINGDVAIW
jgi:hypothetical protein